MTCLASEGAELVEDSVSCLPSMPMPPAWYTVIMRVWGKVIWCTVIMTVFFF